MTNLLPSPYQTNCFDYTTIGCKSRSDCIDKCNIEGRLKECNSLPLWTNVDGRNGKDRYLFGICNSDFNYSICENKYKSPDCTNEYYKFKLISDQKLSQSYEGEALANHLMGLNQTVVKDIDLLVHVNILFGDQFDTVYNHTPQQYPVEFICFIGGIISLWTGLSVLSIYTHGTQFFGRQNQLNQQLDPLFMKKTKTVPIKEKQTNKTKKFDKRLSV